MDIVEFEGEQAIAFQEVMQRAEIAELQVAILRSQVETLRANQIVPGAEHHCSYYREGLRPDMNSSCTWPTHAACNFSRCPIRAAAVLSKPGSD